MQKIKLAVAAAFLSVLWGATTALAQHNHGGGGGGHAGHRGQPQEAAVIICPLRVLLFEPALKNTESGVEITLTAKDVRNITRLRELAALHFSSKEEMEKSCPARVGGAKTAVEETERGAKITITAQAPAAIETIQVAAAYACKREEPVAKRVFKTYACPMGEYQSSRPGKCPKCGMDLVEKK